MTSLPPHHPPTRPAAASGDSACTGTVAEREAGAASVSAASPDANVAIVVSRLIAMGVNVSFRPLGSASESPVGNDGAQPSEPQAVRRQQYEAHIGSGAWKNGAARMAELKASGFRCRICNRGREDVRLEVHHRTYRNFGCELVSDLTTLCADCHVVNTDMLRRRRYAVHHPVSADVPTTERGAPLFDPMAPGESS
jgi:5-methylcytosine-specific restriction endonuclease McrA